MSWLNRSVNNLQSAVLDGNVFLSNSRSAPEILTTNVRAYLGPTSEVYSLRTPESSRAEEQHSITINNENDTTTPPGIDSAEDDNGEENAEENNNPDGDNNMLIDRRVSDFFFKYLTSCDNLLSRNILFISGYYSDVDQRIYEKYFLHIDSSLEICL